MTPEDIQALIEALNGTQSQDNGILTYLLYGFYALIAALLPFVWRFVKLIMQTVKIMDLHIDHLKYLRDEIIVVKEKVEKLDESQNEMGLDVVKNTTNIDAMLR